MMTGTRTGQGQGQGQDNEDRTWTRTGQGGHDNDDEGMTRETTMEGREGTATMSTHQPMQPHTSPHVQGGAFKLDTIM